eukprot:CAMPEP_0197614714 /NCGR_PEP_ID=MMETSP1326-20131121/59666_1 /TAXON_ID=1155430 /ORGANISM="Genus nov. species nov., Strain RCC2288" /LENGTH=189 /DNA_ID=CAMNT_0043183591 /DNA_START=75 /DNA_END=644 /DNA_ORIENTATION=+
MRLKGGSGGGADPGMGCQPSPYVKWETKRNHDMHKDKIAKMKPSVDNKAPPRFNHLVVNAKKAQNEEDRLTEIEHQNRLLLHNLSKIAERKGVEGENRNRKSLQFGEAPTGPTKSLNIGSRQQELNRIERENAAILRRIQDQNHRASEFSVRKMEEEWKETLGHRKLASQWATGDGSQPPPDSPSKPPE